MTGPFPVLYADAFFLDGDLLKKPGRLAAGDTVRRGRPGGRMAGATSCSWTATSSTTTASSSRSTWPRSPQEGLHLRPGDRRPGPAPWSPSPGVLSSLLDCLHRQRHGQFALSYGKDPSVNGILASFWGLAAEPAVVSRLPPGAFGVQRLRRHL